jgi:hypothetical protein
VRVQFLVDSGRYPSIFDVMRDRHGIKRGPEDVTTFAVGLQHGASDRPTTAFVHPDAVLTPRGVRRFG